MLKKHSGLWDTRWLHELGSWIYLTTHTNLSPIRRRFAPGFVHYKKWCTRLTTASDQVYQLLAHGRWFSPSTPASSTTKTCHHDIAESGIKYNKSNLQCEIIQNMLIIFWTTILTSECIRVLCYDTSQDFSKGVW